MITGLWPHEHQIWQVSLNEDLSNTWATRLLDLLPDWATTAYGCCRHLIYTDYDLAAIPWRRRRHFDQHRFKYTRRQGGDASLGEGSQVGTLFNWLGDQSRYAFAMHFADIPKLQTSLPTGHYALEFLEFYAFDILSHWDLDRPTVMRKHLYIVDNFVRTLHRQCQQKGVTMILLVDHGQELVQDSINLKRQLEQTGVPRNEYHYFIEVGLARLWFKTDHARRSMMRVLENTPHVHVYTWEQLRQFNVCFKDNRFGDVYLITDRPIGVSALIGFLMLIGIVVSNAILLVDTVNVRRREGVPLEAVILRAGRARLRPILLTRLTTILGLLPMALALGEGAESNAPLAIAVIGGLAVSTLLTLVFIPVLYHLFEQRRTRPASSASPAH